MSILKDSSVYQLMMAELEADFLKKTLLRIGRKRLGPPDDGAMVVLQKISDVPRLERMTDQVHEVKSWVELLATP